MNLSDKIMERLKASQYWNARTRISGNTIQGIVCPVCGDKSAWGYAPGPSVSNPMAICCNKQNTCGVITKTMELFNIDLNIEKEYPATPEDKHRPAREYLKSRGLKTSLESLPFEYWPKVRKLLTTGAVMFPIQSPGENTVYNGRLINPKESDGKTHNSGSTTGAFWMHQGVEYDQNQNTFVTEGIIDSLSLIELGFQSIAILAAGQDPQKIKLPPLGKLVFFFDPDLAGAKALARWKKTYPEADSIMCDKGKDCNDLLRSGSVEKVKDRFKKDYSRYQTNAKLAVAATARQYAATYHDFHQKAPGLFNHLSSTYYATLKAKGDSTTISLERVGKFTLKVVAYFWDTTNPNNHECRYQLEISPKGGQPVMATATGKDLSTPRSIKELLLSRTKVSFEGGTQAATALATWIATAKAPEVTTLPLVGFDTRSKWYVFASFAIDKTGKCHKPDKRGFFKVSQRSYAQPPAHAADKAIIPSDTGKSIKEIHKYIFEGWGHRGAACLAWVVCSWFTSLIKEKINFMPFLDIFGDVQSAKTSLAVVLAQLQGFDNEGITASSLNTRKGMVRSIGRVSNLFSAILEGNTRDDKSGFDHSSILPLYNRNPLRTTAMYSTDLQTVETPFAGALAFVANNSVFQGKAERERVISIEFKTGHLTEVSKASHDQLCKIPLPELARTIVLTLRHRQVFEKEWYGGFLLACKDLQAINNRRIRENHALPLAFHRVFCKIHGIKNCRLKDYLEKIGKRKEITAADREHSVVEDLFEKIDMIDDSKLVNCLHTDKETSMVYLYLPGIEQNLRSIGFQFSANKQLFDAFQQHPAFVKSRFAFRFPNTTEIALDGRPKLRKVWVFSARNM